MVNLKKEERMLSQLMIWLCIMLTSVGLTALPVMVYAGWKGNLTLLGRSMLVCGGTLIAAWMIINVMVVLQQHGRL